MSVVLRAKKVVAVAVLLGHASDGRWSCTYGRLWVVSKSEEGSKPSTTAMVLYHVSYCQLRPLSTCLLFKPFSVRLRGLLLILSSSSLFLMVIVLVLALVSARCVLRRAGVTASQKRMVCLADSSTVLVVVVLCCNGVTDFQTSPIQVLFLHWNPTKYSKPWNALE